MADVPPVVRHNRGSIPRATKPCRKKFIRIDGIGPAKNIDPATTNFCSEFPLFSFKSN
jgi:hypothetical protein